MPNKILVVDDETGILESLKAILEDEGYETVTVTSAELAMERIQSGRTPFDAAFVDIWMDGMDGLELLDWIKQHYAKLPVIIMSGHGTIETAVKATKKGAYDFVEKPLSLEKTLIILKHALKEVALEKENEELKKQNLLNSIIIGQSKEICSVLKEIELAAPSDGWVLINGENGTGKELVARQIHSKSLRKNRAFIELNCAAIPEELIESELFGHEKGSFTGATHKKIGKFDQANGGTLFLDEIGDMSLKTQAKILRVLQEQRFERVGGAEMFKVNVRVIAASNKNLQEEITKGHFREDLYYRLNVIPIEIPPLRERKDDISILTEYFLELFSANGRRAKKTISQEAMKSLLAYHWPGNIRELKNIVERMVIMVTESVITIQHVPPVIRLANNELLKVTEFPETLKEAKESFEKQYIQSVLKKNQWNISKTAETIQIERSNLHRKIKQLGIRVLKT